MKKDIAIAGVGGQGNLFASSVLCQYAMEKGLNVLGTETIGAAQRGGSVVSHMRISDEVIYSPIIPPNMADVLLGMETLELIRHIQLLQPEGYYIMNLYSVPTVYSNLGIDRYPSQAEIRQAAQKVCPTGYEVPATYKAAELGNPQMTNVVMLGALIKVDDFFDFEGIKNIIARTSPARFQERNIAGYEAGYALL